MLLMNFVENDIGFVIFFCIYLFKVFKILCNYVFYIKYFIFICIVYICISIYMYQYNMEIKFIFKNKKKNILPFQQNKYTSLTNNNNHIHN